MEKYFFESFEQFKFLTDHVIQITLTADTANITFYPTYVLHQELQSSLSLFFIAV
jgi:hypothetical protein